jgi:hypothetical protein
MEVVFETYKRHMEYQKDTQKDIVSVYRAPNDFYVHARKLVSAIYLITGLLDEQEPLKWSLRKKVLDMMSLIGVITRSIGPELGKESEREIIEDITGIKSLLDIGVVAGIISTMNHEILLREISVFQENAVQQLHANNGSQSLFTDALFANTNWNFSNTQQKSKGQFKKTQQAYKRQYVFPLKSKTSNQNQPKKDISSASQNERKQKILETIKEKGSVMIKDISQGFPNVSEKTIQRDLSDLVGRGSVLKSGERRWTVYTLAK